MRRAPVEAVRAAPVAAATAGTVLRAQTVRCEPLSAAAVTGGGALRLSRPLGRQRPGRVVASLDDDPGLWIDNATAARRLVLGGGGVFGHRALLYVRKTPPANL